MVKIQLNDTPSHRSTGEFKKHILVTYGSRMGSTVAVAKAIASELNHRGNLVELKKINDVSDLNGFDAVVVGSPIQYDQWLPEARDFFQKFQFQLSKLPVACFFTCLTLSSSSKKARKSAQQYSKKIASLHPRIIEIGSFAGVLDFSRFDAVVRWAARILFFFLGVSQGDYRDWKQIQMWAEKIDSMLNPCQTSDSN